MNPFLREHARPLIGSAVLHVVLLAGGVVAAWISVAPKVVQPAAIEAYLAPAPRAHVGAMPEPAPADVPQPAAPEPAPAPAPAPTPDPAVVERQHEAAEAAQKAQAQRLEKLAEQKAASELAHRKAAELDARRKADAEAKRKADAEAKQKADADAKHKQDLDAKAAAKRAAAEEARVKDALAKEKARLAAEAQKREQGEADLARQLADEQHRLGAENAGLQAKYVALLRAAIERNWTRPATAKAGIRCIVDVSQVPGGTVTDVQVGTCNGDGAVVESIKNAVYKASPLPPPPDPSLFERKLHLVFNPDG